MRMKNAGHPKSPPKL